MGPPLIRAVLCRTSSGDSSKPHGPAIVDPTHLLDASSSSPSHHLQSDSTGHMPGLGVAGSVPAALGAVGSLWRMAADTFVRRAADAPPSLGARADACIKQPTMSPSKPEAWHVKDKSVSGKIAVALYVQDQHVGADTEPRVVIQLALAAERATIESRGVLESEDAALVTPPPVLTTSTTASDNKDVEQPHWAALPHLFTPLMHAKAPSTGQGEGSATGLQSSALNVRVTLTLLQCGTDDAVEVTLKLSPTEDASHLPALPSRLASFAGYFRSAAHPAARNLTAEPLAPVASGPAQSHAAGTSAADRHKPQADAWVASTTSMSAYGALHERPKGEAAAGIVATDQTGRLGSLGRWGRLGGTGSSPASAEAAGGYEPVRQPSEGESHSMAPLALQSSQGRGALAVVEEQLSGVCSKAALPSVANLLPGASSTVTVTELPPSEAAIALKGAAAGMLQRGLGPGAQAFRDGDAGMEAVVLLTSQVLGSHLRAAAPRTAGWSSYLPARRATAFAMLQVKRPSG